jgi:hypothetical protein
MLRNLRSLSPALAVALLAAPAAAHAAPVVKKKATSAKAKVVYPTVSSISPRKITIGQKLTVKGAHFRPGKGKSSLAFYKAGKPVVFVAADSATTTKLVVTIPDKVANLLSSSSGKQVRTLLRLRVVGAKMGRTWTQNSRSPLVAPLPTVPLAPGTDPNSPAAVQQAAAIAYKTCQQAAATTPNGDQDTDGLTNATEIAYKLDPCIADTDGDTFTDGYEFFSAVDLNGSAVPYPGSRPWPNPLDPTDGVYDFDGDGLLLWQEFALWKASGAHFPLTQYSDGTQNSGGTHPVTTTAEHYLDVDKDGNLTDEERDFDGDGLSNITEFSFRGTQAWWRGITWYDQPHGDGTIHTYAEQPYTGRLFSDVDATNPDTDGDGIPDGADDQDNDGWSNYVEMQLSRDEVGYRVQPYNPCLPDPHARVCGRYTPLFGTPWPPFDQVYEDPNTHAIRYSGMPGDGIPFSWPVDSYASWVGASQPAHFEGTVFGPWDPAPFFTESWNGSSGPQGA